MTELLDKALSEAAKLPAQEQDALAAILLAEIESETRWADAFTKSQDMLATMAEDARAEYAEGKTRPL